MALDNIYGIGVTSPSISAMSTCDVKFLCTALPQIGYSHHSKAISVEKTCNFKREMYRLKLVQICS